MNQIINQANPQMDSSSYDIMDIALKIVLTAIVMFIAGLIITLASQEIIGYKDFPNTGRITSQADGTPVFTAKFKFFRNFIYSSKDVPLGQEDNKFKRAGLLGRGLFFYSVLNAPHWIWEVGYNNLRGLVLYPLFIILIGAGFFFKLLPESLKTSKNALSFSVAIAVLHSLIVAIVLLVSTSLSVTFRSLFDPPFYIGELTGALLPAYFIIVFTGLLYGAIAGGLLSGYLSLFSGSRR